jgi:hypothetical protein
MRKVIIIAACMFALCSSIKAQQDRKKTLQGLPGVAVVVEHLNKDVESNGITIRQIQTDVELRLRKAGIKVFSIKELESEVRYPALYVRVSGLTSHLGICAYSIDVNLMQAIYLINENRDSTLATTWDLSYAGVVRVENIKKLREIVIEGIDEFINE